MVEQIHRRPTILKDDPGEHRGRPRTSYTEENRVIVEALIREDRKVRETAEMTGILKSAMYEIMADFQLPNSSRPVSKIMNECYKKR